MIDVSDIANGNMNEMAFFDSHPSNNGVNFDGVWNVYPFFESGNIMIADRDRGVFIVRDSNSPLATVTNEINLTSIFPNPANDRLNIQSNQANINSIEVFDVLGKQIIIKGNLNNSTNYIVDISNLKTGFYFVKVNDSKTRKFIKK